MTNVMYGVLRYYRRVRCMYEVGDGKQKQIKERTGIKIPTVESRLRLKIGRLTAHTLNKHGCIPRDAAVPWKCSSQSRISGCHKFRVEDGYRGKSYVVATNY